MSDVLPTAWQSVVYADPRNDITKDVVHNLNLAYKAAGGTAPRAAAPAASGGVNPAGAGATQTNRPPGFSTA